MDKMQLIQKIASAAKATKNDAESNMLSRVVDRLIHVGAPYEKPLTNGEIDIISRFL
jgi:hypothetical protein